MSDTIQIDPGGISILVVDDEVSILKVVRRTLEPEGFRIFDASDGEQAVEHLSKRKTDIVITDVAMPGMDGLELTRRIVRYFSSDVIVMTGQINQYRYDQFVGIGASDFLQKPFTPEEMVLRVGRVIRERQFQKQLFHTHNQLAQNQKLEALGQISSGIVHEIKTPVQFITDNLEFLKDSLGDLDSCLQAAAIIAGGQPRGEPETLSIEPFSSGPSREDIDFIRSELPKAVDESIQGLGRINEIIDAVKSFSHPGDGDHSPADINECIQNAVTMSKHEWKHTAMIRMDLEDQLPLISCNPGQLTQVFLNLIINACHAISECRQETGAEMGGIEILSRGVPEGIRIQIADTGVGIPKKNLSRIFDPFFTTKSPGVGTGQGLAIARTIVEKRHDGKITVASSENEGSTFQITLPSGDTADN